MAVKYKVIRNNQSITPFFGERLSFIRGLDPLGLQNTSDTTFTLLMPGLNNVTGRIRYYSFYSWLLDQYSKINGSTDPAIQKTFIRKAEYIIALSAQFYAGESGSIPGSNYAKTEVQNQEIQVHDLNAGIYKPDGTTANTYWNYSWGAFGQYYIGSLRDIGIVISREDSEVYARTNSQEDHFVSGEMLADAFDSNIPTNKKELFLKCLTESSISEEQLKDLLPEFNLTHVPENTKEQELLIRLLLQKDIPLRIEEEPITLRKDSIRHLLQFVASQPEKFDDREFIYTAYNNKGKADEKIENSLLGWYYYQFNEFWHYANTSLFNGTLNFLEENYGPNWVPLNQLIDNLANGVLQLFVEEELVTDANNTVEAVLHHLKADEYHYMKAASKSLKAEKVFYGFLMIFSQYLNNLEELALLKNYGDSNHLAKDGDGVTYFLGVFKTKQQIPLIQYIKEYLFKNIIYRHQYVAFRKMRGSTLSTQKFIIEDHHIRYLGNFDAGYTGPRIGNVISFLKDLSVITTDNALTAYGEDVLTQLSAKDD
jgi:hypothetical protein